MIGPRHSKEEFARRGDEIYERDIVSRFGPDDEGKFVVIDIETGAYEVDRDEIAASDRLLARRPDAQVWLRRVGSRYARRVGKRQRAEMSLSKHWPRRNPDHRGISDAARSHSMQRDLCEFL